MEETRMRQNRNITIIRAVVLSLLLFASASLMAAHEGFDHVTGTIAKVNGNVVTVTTAKGNVDVKLDSKTEITRNDLKAQVADLKPGTRVVVDIPEGSKDKVAHSVKIGVASPAKPAATKPAGTP
jgi:hypothetical protein